MFQIWTTGSKEQRYGEWQVFENKLCICQVQERQNNCLKNYRLWALNIFWRKEQRNIYKSLETIKSVNGRAKLTHLISLPQESFFGLFLLCCFQVTEMEYRQISRYCLLFTHVRIEIEIDKMASSVSFGKDSRECDKWTKRREFFGWVFQESFLGFALFH